VKTNVSIVVTSRVYAKRTRIAIAPATARAELDRPTFPAALWKVGKEGVAVVGTAGMYCVEAVVGAEGVTTVTITLVQVLVLPLEVIVEMQVDDEVVGTATQMLCSQIHAQG
jgi:hypothetical protein